MTIKILVINVRHTYEKQYHQAITIPHLDRVNIKRTYTPIPGLHYDQPEFGYHRKQVYLAERYQKGKGSNGRSITIEDLTK